MSDIHSEIRGRAGLITLNRPKALNALSLPMVRALTGVLLDWEDHNQIEVVAIRGMGKDSANPAGAAPFGAFAPAATSAFSTRPHWRATRRWRISSPRNTR